MHDIDVYPYFPESWDLDRSYNVSTGGGPGIMEAANRGAHEAGDTTLGFGASRPEIFGCKTRSLFLVYISFCYC